MKTMKLKLFSKWMLLSLGISGCDPPNFIEHAQNLEKEGKYAEAAHVYRTAIGQLKDSPDVVERLAAFTAAAALSNLELEQAQYDNAAETLTVALDLAESLNAEEPTLVSQKNIADLYAMRAAAFKQMGSIESARRDAARSLEIEAEIERQAQAIREYEEMIRTSPSEPAPKEKIAHE